MIIRKTLYAEEGKVITDGEGYYDQITLAVGMDESAFYEITKEEYKQLFPEEQTEEILEVIE